MPGRIPLSILVALAACTWAVVLVALGADVELGFFKPFSIVVGVIATALAAFDRWVWRWPGVRALHGRPQLAGTYWGEIRSDWKDRETGQKVGPIPAALVVGQTFTGLSVSLFTAESSSATVAASLVDGSDGRQLVAGLYRNEPRLSVQERSRVHYGGLKLDIGGEAEDRLHGSYWTDRGTSGELDFQRVDSKRARDFEMARALSASDAPAQVRSLPEGTDDREGGRGQHPRQGEGRAGDVIAGRLHGAGCQVRATTRPGIGFSYGLTGAAVRRLCADGTSTSVRPQRLRRETRASTSTSARWSRRHDRALTH